MAALRDCLQALGDRRIAVCREITKLHEEVFRGTVSQSIAHFLEPRGEFTLVIEGGVGPQDPSPASEAEARTRLTGMRAEGVRAKEAVAHVSTETGLSRRRVYRLWLETKGGSGATG